MKIGSDVDTLITASVGYFKSFDILDSAIVTAVSNTKYKHCNKLRKTSENLTIYGSVMSYLRLEEVLGLMREGLLSFQDLVS